MNKKIKIFIILILVLFTTGCAQQLVDSNKKPIVYKETGQTLTKNILCKPKNKEIIEKYKKGKVNLEKLPECENITLTDGKYEGLWTNLFVKPLAYAIIKINYFVKSYALSLIIVTILIRLLVYPLTKKMAVQSEQMKKASPELKKVQEKYKGKEDKDAMMKMQVETMAIYKKYNINPTIGCVVALIQLPLFLGFFEAIQRTPAIYEDKFLTLQLGTIPNVGIFSSNFYSYIILMILIGATTYLTFKFTQTEMPNMNGAEATMKMMPIMMTVMIVVTGLFMPSGLGVYWITSNVFTIIQNIIVKRSRKNVRV